MTRPTVALRRFVLDACDGPFGSAITGEHYADEGARVIRLGNVGGARWIDSDKAYLPFDYWASLRSHHAIGGDVVIAGRGDDGNPVGRACVVPELGPALVKADCYRLRLDTSQADPRFLAWFLSSSAGLAQAMRLADGATRPRLTLGKALGLRVPVLPLAGQRAIANYLERETKVIDHLIAAKRQMVALLDERWQVVMSNAVAGKLTAPNASRRGTSVPWLTDVPLDWREGHLKHAAKLGTGHTPSRLHPEWWTDLTIPWITTGEVYQMRSDRIENITETREAISELGMTNSSATLHPAGTVVLCRTASAGYSAIMAQDMATSQDFATWTCGPMLRPRFLLLCLRAMRQDLLGRLAMGSTHQTIYMPDIEAIKIPLPPVDEQDAIVTQAYSRQRALDVCSRRLDRQIVLLQERRQALITAAVTDRPDAAEAA
jgi:type I restriction enzyme S subunit